MYLKDCGFVELGMDMNTSFNGSTWSSRVSWWFRSVGSQRLVFLCVRFSNCSNPILRSPCLPRVTDLGLVRFKCTEQGKSRYSRSTIVPTFLVVPSRSSPWVLYRRGPRLCRGGGGLLCLVRVHGWRRRPTSRVTRRDPNRGKRTRLTYTPVLPWCDPEWLHTN